MPTDTRNQVDLFHLLFGRSWEDPAADARALKIIPTDTLLTVTSGCCNTFTLLLEDPARIYAVDINPTQSHLLELKSAAIRHLAPDELLAFLGFTPSTTRPQTFERLSPDLTPAAREYWLGQPKAIANGVIHAGRFETFVSLFARLVRLVQGRKRIDGLFACTSLAEQQAFFDRHWNTPQWRLLFKVLVSKRVLNKRMSVDYFKFDDGSASFAESFLRRARRAICEIPLASNYFLPLFLRGDYLNQTAIPAYLLPENLPVVKARLDRIHNITAPAQEWLAAQPAGSIHCFALSNICELMSEEETSRLFTEVAHAAAPNARIIFRNLMIPREVPAALQPPIALDEPFSRDLLATDRSFVYSRVHAYTVQ